MGAIRLGRSGRGRPRRRPGRLAGGKGYSHRRIRGCLRRGIKAVIPGRRGQRPDHRRVRFDREAYRRRNVVERCANFFKEHRRSGTPYEKPAANFLAPVKLAAIRHCFKRLDSSDGA